MLSSALKQQFWAIEICQGEICRNVEVVILQMILLLPSDGKKVSWYTVYITLADLRYGID